VSVPAGCDGPTTAGRYFADDVVSAPFTFADGMLHPLERAGPRHRGRRGEGPALRAGLTGAEAHAGGDEV
jgi:hypothetical protein